MKRILKRHRFSLLAITLFSITIAYYLTVLLHEWGHGTTAWLLNQKSSPLDIYYGHSWYLSNVDEKVDYNTLLATGYGLTAALIGVSGVGVDIIMVILCLSLLRKSSVQKSTLWFSFFYWFLIFNMVPIFQYVPLTTFSVEGDIGRFVHGLNISPG